MLHFLLLLAHTLLFWFSILFLHKRRHQLTLMPFYGVLAALTVLTHVLSTAGSHVIVFNTFFLISSTAYFTSLMMGIYILYIIDGPAAARKALQLVLGVSLLHVITVTLVHYEDPSSTWISFGLPVFRDYLFSILAIIVDIIVIGIGWEFIGKIKIKNTFISVSLIMFLVFAVDTLVFVSGVFINTPMYLHIIKTDLIVRLFQSIIMGFFISRYLVSIKFSEDTRKKPKNFWEIINFSSEDEKKIFTLQEELKRREELTKELKETQETYKQMLEGINVGVYQINYINNKEFWSDKLYSILGYTPGSVIPSYKKLLDFIKEEDRIELIKNPTSIEIELRIVDSKENFKWYKYTRFQKFDDSGKKIEEIGSFIDIDSRKKFEKQLNDKIDTMNKINKITMNREMQMIELKQELKSLKSQLSK